MFRSEHTTQNQNRKPWCTAILALSLLLLGTLEAPGQDPPPLPDADLLDKPSQPGTIEGSGTQFEITDSEYLNVTLDSSASLNLKMESIPQMVVMEIEAAEGATTTALTMGGFAPSTMYYKYEDDYHNGAAITTDDNGGYIYEQDLTTPHRVFIQPTASTWFLNPTAGQVPTIGEWDAGTRTFTLTEDVYETIQIDEDDLTLDGGSRPSDGTPYTVSGFGTGYGIYLYARTGVTVRNMDVQHFSSGIHLYGSSNNTLISNTTAHNYTGIRLVLSNTNTLIENSAHSNTRDGLSSTGCATNTLSGNTLSSNNYFGLSLVASTGHTLTDNAMSGNRYNFGVQPGSNPNTLYHDIDTTNTVEGRPIYYVRDAVGTVYGASTNAGVFFAINCDSITVQDLTLSQNWRGIYLHNTHNSTIENVSASNNDTGLYLYGSMNNTLIGNDIRDNARGIMLHSTYSDVLTDNFVSGSYYDGIYIYTGGNITLTGNVMSGNSWNLRILYPRPDHDIDTSNTVDGRPVYYVVGASGEVYDASTNAGTFYAVGCDNISIRELTPGNNGSGVYLYNTHNSTIENVSASSNLNGIFLYSSNNNTLINNTATGSLPPGAVGIRLYYSSGNTLTDNTASDNGQGVILWNSNNNALTGNTTSHNGHGIFLSGSSDNVVADGTTDSNNFGLYLQYASDNIFTGNSLSDNTRGIHLSFSSDGNTLTRNTLNLYYANYNMYGVILSGSSYNQVYNNNIIGNVTHERAVDYSGVGNVFTLPAPIGGNYWSNWTGPDADADGFVDVPYVFDGGQDNLPWAVRDGWVQDPISLIEQLIAYVESLNLQHGIENGLDAKLNAALQAIEDINNNNDAAAVNTLQAFINAVQAQAGNQIPNDEAAALNEDAQFIIDLLSG